jgi:hypothetical protein
MYRVHARITRIEQDLCAYIKGYNRSREKLVLEILALSGQKLKR